jgi:hypothetical protein
VPHVLGGLQKTEKDEEYSDIKKREGFGNLKSQTPLDREGVAIERIEWTDKYLRMAHKNG